MKKSLWDGCLAMVTVLFIVSVAQSTLAQQPGLEQAREPVSATVRFGERSVLKKARLGEERAQPGAIKSVEYRRSLSSREARRRKAVRRDSAVKITKAEPRGQRLARPGEEFQEGVELAREPVSPVGNFGERSETPEVRLKEEDNRPGLIKPNDYDRSISRERAQQLKMVRRDPARKVIKGQRPN